MSSARACSALLFASAAWIVIASAPSSTGCANCSTGGQEPIAYSEGDTTGSSYETSPPGGTWLHFPAGRRFRLAHGLGSDRLSVHGYLSFSERPFPGADPDAGSGNASEASGNALVIEAENERYVQVRNDSCAEYYLRVVIQRQ